MLSLITFIFILIVSALVTKVATIALVHTGLSRQMAQFQATSAFAGVGYPGKESEHIINHPVRRKIVRILMLLGKAGLVTIIASFLITFLQHEETDALNIWQKVSILIISIGILWLLFSSKTFDIILSRGITHLLKKFTKLNVKDYAAILHLAGEYEIAELSIEKNNWLANKTLAETELRHEGISIMGITRADGTFIGAPGGAAKIEVGDLLLLYGRSEGIKALDERKKGVQGKLSHEISVMENEKLQEAQLQRDPVALKNREKRSGIKNK